MRARAVLIAVLAATFVVDGIAFAQQRSKRFGFFELPRLSIGRQRVDTTGFELSKDNGPYMVLVTTFLGSSAKQNALKLARELREKHGIPAYIYVWDPQSRLGTKRLGLLSRVEQVAVLAGNFDDLDGEAQTVLRKIKRLQPECLSNDGPFPLRGAILVYNPLVPPALRKKPRQDGDSLLRRINQGPYNIVHCRGKYTLQVAIWTGQILVGPDAEKDLTPSDKLYEAANNAEELVRLLRKAGYEAYVFHGRQASAVTVGSFNDTNDPQIASLIQQLAGKKFGKHQLLKTPYLVYTPSF